MTKIIRKIPFEEQYCEQTHRTTLTRCGNHVTLKSVEYCNTKIYIKKLDKDTYLDLRTGEIKQFQHGNSRKDAQSTLYQTFQSLRDLINANLSADTADNALWVTLTYAENMTDPKRLYDDFRKFNMRLKYHCQKNGLPRYEYITVVEPQQRGAWHHHLLLIWDSEAPFIANQELAQIWGHGFVKLKKLRKNVSNIGAYLTAYLTDLPIEEAQSDTDLPENDHLLVKTSKGKKFIKGARLHLYPSGMQIYRHSKGIKQPEITVMPYREARRMLSDQNAELKYRKAVFFWEDYFGNTIFTQHYDTSDEARVRALKKKQDKLWSEFPEINDYLDYGDLNYPPSPYIFPEDTEWLPLVASWQERRSRLPPED